MTRSVPDRERLRDPLVVEWLMERIRDAREVDAEERAEALGRVLDDEILSEHLRVGGATARGLLLTLPAERFAPFVDDIVRSWHASPAGERWIEGRCLAEIAPDRLAELLAEALAELDGPAGRSGDDPADGRPDPTLLADLASDLGQAGAGLVRDALRYLPPWEQGSGHAPPVGVIVTALLRVGSEGEAAHVALQAVLAGEWPADDTDEVLDDAWSILAPRSPWLVWVRDALVEEGGSVWDVAPLLPAGAPLDAIDDVLATDLLPEVLDGARRLLPDDDGTSLVRFARRLADALQTGPPDELPDWGIGEVAAFVLAAAIEASAGPGPDLDGLGLEEVVHLAALDLVELPGRQALPDRLAGEDPAEVARVARRVLDDVEERWEGLHLVELLAELGGSAYLDVVLDAFTGRWAGEGIADHVEAALARFGPAAEEALIERWDAFDHDLDDRPTDVLAVLGGPRAVELTLAGIERDRADCEALARWARLAASLGDARPARPLARELHRGISEVDWAVGVLDALHGLDLPGAAEARGRVVGPRRRAGDELVCCECAARHDDEGEDDDLRWLRGVVLHCPACGETNRYDLDRVYATRRAGEPDPYLGDDLECPSCGAAEGLAPSPLGAG